MQYTQRHLSILFAVSMLVVPIQTAVAQKSVRVIGESATSKLKIEVGNLRVQDSQSHRQLHVSQSFTVEIRPGVTPEKLFATIDGIQSFTPVFKSSGLKKTAPQKLRRKLINRAKRAQKVKLKKRTSGYYLLTTVEGALEQAMQSCRSHPDIISVSSNRRATLNAFPKDLPNDDFVDPEGRGEWSRSEWVTKAREGGSESDLYNLEMIQAADAWKFALGEDIVVAIVDTGAPVIISHDGEVSVHPDIIENLWLNEDEIKGGGHAGQDMDGNGYAGDYFGYNFVDQTFDVSEDYFHPKGTHGSHLMGTIGAEQNHYGAIGVAPRVKLMPLKISSHNILGWPIGESMTPATIAAAIDYATKNGADIINLSLGVNGSPPEVLTTAIQNAAASGILIIAAAGNDGSATRNVWPCAYEEVLCVASVDSGKRRSSFSNYGSQVALSGYGKMILSTDTMIDPDTNRVLFDYSLKSGTSMAAPLVAGVAALALSANPTLSIDELTQILLNSTDPYPQETNDRMGSGVINAFKAVTRALESDKTRPSEEGWHNRVIRWDVSGDGEVSPQDALLIINYLNRYGAMQLPTQRPQHAFYLDVTNDGYVSPQDALQVINRMNAVTREIRRAQGLSATGGEYHYIGSLRTESGVILTLEQSSRWLADVNNDGIVNLTDREVVYHHALFGSYNENADFNGDGKVTEGDFDYYMSTIVRHDFGDTDGDGLLCTNDIVLMFQSGNYEKGGFSDISGGDWNLDAEFTSADLVKIFSWNSHSGYNPACD